MKKSFLLFIASIAMVAANAQQRNSAPHSSLNRASDNHVVNNLGSDFGSGARTTTTLYHYDEEMRNCLTTDSLWFYYASAATVANTDSGYFLGTSIFGGDEFMERYDFTGADSMVKVIGIVSIFHGTVNASSTHTVSFRMRNVAAPTVSSATLTYSGFPGTLADSLAGVPYTSLGIGPVGTGDTFKVFFFADSGTAAYRTTSFFIGWGTNYSWAAMNADTISTLTSSYNHNLQWTIASGDTTINDQCVADFPGFGGWLDERFDLGAQGDYFLFAAIDASYSSTLGVNGITNKGFTFYGNYPTPAVNSTNVRFSLAKGSDVTIRITDMSGRIINTINENNLTSGEHTISVSTSNLPAGNYLFAINSSTGGGIASKFTVVK